MKFLLNTTPWENGCGLATISYALSQTHFMSGKHLPEHALTYQKLQAAFSKIYRIPKVSRKAIQRLFSFYQHPEDQQKLWIGPLRLILGETLRHNQSYRDTFFTTFVWSLNQYVKADEPHISDEYANIILSNQNFFTLARDNYWRVRATRRQAIERDIFQTTKLQAYWQRIGYERYCQALQQVTGTSLQLTAEEMSMLCASLQLRFEIHQKDAENPQTFKKIDHICQGYEETNPLATVAAICTFRHWQPIVNSMSHAFRQQLLWKQGYRQLAQYSYAAIVQAARTTLRTPMKKFKAPKLEKAMNLGHYQLIAQMSQEQAYKQDPDNGFYANIDVAVKEKDFSTLLSIYYYKPNSRNYILSKALSTQGTGFVTDLLKYYHLLPNRLDDIQQWPAALEKAIPCIEQTLLDHDLHAAIRHGDNVSAKKLIADGEDIYLENSHQVSPLHLVCHYENKVLLTAMIAQEKSIKQQGSLWQRFKYFGLNLYQQDSSGKTSLHYAASATSEEFVAELLALRANPLNIIEYIHLGITDKEGKTPLHIAAINTQRGVLDLFLNHFHLNRGGLNSQDQVGLTPLHYAVATKRYANMQSLLRAKADPNISAYPDKIKAIFPHFNAQLSKLTPLWIALELEDLVAAKTLIIHVQQLTHTVNSKGYNALQLAVLEGNTALLTHWDTMFPKSQLLFWTDSLGRKLIHLAAMAGKLDVIEYYVTKGAVLSVLDAESNSVLHYAAQYGHLAIVEYLCNKAKEDTKYNQQLAMRGGLYEFLHRRRFLIQIDADNAYGETPYALAQIYDHDAVSQRLHRQGAKTISLSEHVVRAIYRNESQTIATAEYKVATIVAKHQRMAFVTDQEGDTLLHHAIKGLNERILRILLHPLPVAERIALCLNTNRQGLTALTLITDLRKRGIQQQSASGKRTTVYQQLSTAQRQVLDKIERALICYHQPSYERQYATLLQRTRYRQACARDLEQEIQRSSGYYYASWATMLGLPIYQAIKTVGIATHPYLIFETAASHFLGDDVIANAELGTSLLLNYCPDSALLKGANWLLWGAGWWCYTGRKMGAELTKVAASNVLSATSLDQTALASKNYITYLNCLGGLYAGLEFAGKQSVGDFLDKYMTSFDQLTAQTFGMRTMKQAVNDTVKDLNVTVREATNVDIAETAKMGYGWFKENVVRLPSSGATLLAHMDEWLIEPLHMTDTAQKEQLKQLLTSMIEQYRYDSEKLLQMTESLTQYVATGHKTEQFLSTLSEAAALQSTDAQNFGEVVAQFILMAPFYRTSHFSVEHRERLSQQIAQEAKHAKQTHPSSELVRSMSEILAHASTTSVHMLSQQAVETHFLPLLNIQNEVLESVLKPGLTALHSKWIETPNTFEENWSELALYLQQGILSNLAATALDHFAGALVAEGNDYAEVITLLTMNNAFYQRFLYEPVLSAGLSQQFTQAMTTVAAAEPEERANKLAEVLRTQQQQAINSYVQTLKPGKEIANDYKNILKRGHNDKSADGLSEYMAQILVFNNPVFFCGLTSVQKQALQNEFKAFFNQIQGGGKQYNERAVIENFDRFKTLIICAPYIEFIISGAEVSEAVPAIFAQLDQKAVRAAVAALQVASMVAEDEGYTSLTITETFELFRTFFDQQYASSAEKIERGMRDIVHETLYEQAIDPQQLALVWGEYTADETANYVAQVSRNIAENRWQGTADVNIRALDYKKQSTLGRITRGIEREARQAFKSGAQDSTVGVTVSNAHILPTYSHLSSGTIVGLSNPFAKTPLTFSMPSRTPTSTPLPSQERTPVLATALAEDKTPTFATAIAEDRTPTFTPLLAANDVRVGNMGVPFWQSESGFWRQVGSLLTNAPTQDSHLLTPQASSKDSHSLVASPANHQQAIVNEFLAHSWGQNLAASLPPELPKSLMSLGATSQSNTLLPVVAPEPSFGDCLLDLVIGKANANPVVLVGAMVAGSAAAGAGVALMQSTLAAWDPQHEDDIVSRALNIGANLYTTSYPLTGGIGLFRKSGQNDKPRPNAPDPDKKYVPAPKELPGFPEASKARSRTPYPGGVRKRWGLPDGKILEWDSQHGEVELYTKKGDHLGAYDPKTGEQIKKPNKNRTIKKFL